MTRRKFSRTSGTEEPSYPKRPSRTDSYWLDVKEECYNPAVTGYHLAALQEEPMWGDKSRNKRAMLAF